MDAITEFQRWIGPLTLNFLADNGPAIKFVVFAGAIIAGWLAADGLKTPRQVFEKLFAKGSSTGKGDIPREE